MNGPLQTYLIVGAAAVVVLVVVFAVLRTRREREPRVDAYVDALKELVDGNQDEAFRRLQQAVRVGLAPTDAYIRLGRLLRERGEPTKALQIHQSLTVKTNLSRNEKVQLFLNLSEDYARLGNARKSVNVLEAAIRNLGIRDAEVYLTLAKHQNFLGNTDRAYDALEEAQKAGGITNRELALYLTSVAEHQAEAGNLREARKTLHRALRRDPNCAAGSMLMGNIAEQLGENDEAIESWKKAALLSPDLASEALHKLERRLFDKGRFSDVEKIYESVRSARQGDEAASLGLAAFYRKQGRTEEAIQLLEELLAVVPNSSRGSLLLTSLYARHRDGDTLEHYLNRSIEASKRPGRFSCSQCEFQSAAMRWHCPRCNAFDTFSANHA